MLRLAARADRRPSRLRSAGLIIIDRWQRTSYRVDLQQTENIDCWISLNVLCFEKHAFGLFTSMWFRLFSKCFEIVQIITKLRVVAHSLVFTINPRMNILNVYYENKCFFIEVYMFLSLLLEITQHNNYFKFIFRIINIDYNR